MHFSLNYLTGAGNGVCVCEKVEGWGYETVNPSELTMEKNRKHHDTVMKQKNIHSLPCRLTDRKSNDYSSFHLRCRTDAEIG